MNMQPTKLSKDVLDRLPPAERGQYIVRDTEERGNPVGARADALSPT